MKRKATFVFLLLSLLVTSCNKHKIGKYVYKDFYKTIHIDRDCASKPSNNPKTKEERIANRVGVTFIDTCDFRDRGYRFCPKCINDETFLSLSNIMERNEEYYTYRKAIYRKLILADYNMEQFDMYVKHIADSEKRRKLYKTACDEGWDVGSYEEFTSKLGFKVKNRN